jgi:transcriptional regulator with XRE-family HTH domain
MKTSEAWVELALKTVGCNQKELARRLGVSATQISKWKNGEYMSDDMEKKFCALLKVDDVNPEFVLWAGSFADAAKWDQLIHRLADDAEFVAESNYEIYGLNDDLGLLCLRVTKTLGDMGVEPPRAFPKELDPYFSGSDTKPNKLGAKDDADEDEDVEDALNKLLDKNPYTALIREIFASLTSVWAFYAAYVENLLNDDDLDFEYDLVSDFEWCLMDLAASKLEVDNAFALGFPQFRLRTRKQYQEWLTTIKDRVFRAGVPLRAELQELLSDDPEELDHTAEAEAWGFNETRLHPDVYMNELLVGMRIIHQVLPAILKKLEIDFKLNDDALRTEAVLTGLIGDRDLKPPVDTDGTEN